MAEEFVITGIGMVCASGTGKETFWDTLINSRTGFKNITRFDTGGRNSHLGGEVPDFDLDAVFSPIKAFGDMPDRRFRRAADVSKYCLASSKLAIDDAGLDPYRWDGSKAGLVVGVTHCAINYSREFHTAMVREGPAAVSPSLFSDSVLNAPAGNVSIAFNIKGAIHTIVGGTPAGIDAIGFATRVMRNSNLDLCLVGCTEEIDSVVSDGYARFGLLSPNDGQDEGIKPFGIRRNGFVIGEGACVLVIERKKGAMERKAKIYAEIGMFDTAACITPGRFRDILKDIGNETAYISTGANGTAGDDIEAGVLQVLCDSGHGSKKPFIGNIKPVTGECFAAGSMLQIASAAMIIQKGIIPPSNIQTEGLDSKFRGLGKFNVSAVEMKINRAAISSIGLKEEGALLVLRGLH